MNIEIVVYDGFDELDAIGPYEVFANALQYAETTGSVHMIASDGSDTVSASHGLRVATDAQPGERAPDLIVVPGGGWNNPGSGARDEYTNGELPRRLATLHDEGVDILTVCTGAMIAAKAGLFDGRAATTHAGAREDLAAEGAVLRDARVVDDGIVSSGGVTAGLDAAVYLVEREFGPAVRDHVETKMEYEPHGTAHLEQDNGTE